MKMIDGLLMHGAVYDLHIATKEERYRGIVTKITDEGSDFIRVKTDLGFSEVLCNGRRIFEDGYISCCGREHIRVYPSHSGRNLDKECRFCISNCKKDEPCEFFESILREREEDEVQ